MPGNVNSPFQCDAGIVSLPDSPIPDRVVIRVDDASDDDKVIFTIDGSDPAADNADGFIKGGEAYEIRGGSLAKASKIKLKAVSGNPLIYFAIH